MSSPRVAWADESGTWKYLFYVCAGFALLPVISGYFLIPPEPARSATQNRRLDWIGAVVITIAMTLLSLSLTQSGTDPRGWKAPCGSCHTAKAGLIRMLDVPALLVTSVALLLVFGYWEYWVERHTSIPPIVKLELFTRHHWRVTAVLVIAFLLWCGICVRPIGLVVRHG